MSDFEKWFADHDACSFPQPLETKHAAKRAWDHQQAEIERLTDANSAYRTVINGATIDNRQKQAVIERLNARLKVVRDQYNGDAINNHALMAEALGSDDEEQGK